MRKQIQGGTWGRGKALVLLGSGQENWAVIPPLFGPGHLLLSLHFLICKGRMITPLGAGVCILGEAGTP